MSCRSRNWLSKRDGRNGCGALSAFFFWHKDRRQACTMLVAATAFEGALSSITCSFHQQVIDFVSLISGKYRAYCLHQEKLCHRQQFPGSTSHAGCRCWTVVSLGLEQMGSLKGLIENNSGVISAVLLQKGCPGSLTTSSSNITTTLIRRGYGGVNTRQVF